MTAAKKNKEKLTHSSEQVFKNVIFPILFGPRDALNIPVWHSLYPNDVSSSHLDAGTSQGVPLLPCPASPIPRKSRKVLLPCLVSPDYFLWMFKPIMICWPQKYQKYERLFWNPSWGSNPTQFLSRGDIIALGGGVKPAAPVAEWKDLLLSSARFSHSSWGAESPRNLLGITQSRIYMQPRLMSHLMLPSKKSQSRPHPAQIRGIKAFNRQSVNSLKNIPSCLYKSLVRNLQRS